MTIRRYFVRTAQHYVKSYKDDEEKRLPSTKKLSRLKGNGRKLEAKHTDFLCNYYDTAATAVLWEAGVALLSGFLIYNQSVFLASISISFNMLLLLLKSWKKL